MHCKVANGLNQMVDYIVSILNPFLRNFSLRMASQTQTACNTYHMACESMKDDLLDDNAMTAICYTRYKLM